MNTPLSPEEIVEIKGRLLIRDGTDFLFREWLNCAPTDISTLLDHISYLEGRANTLRMEFEAFYMDCETEDAEYIAPSEDAVTRACVALGYITSPQTPEPQE